VLCTPSAPEEQIIGVLKEAEAGAKTADLARRHGVSEATIYNWKAKYGGLEVSEARRLRELESENAKLKRLLADTMLDNVALTRRAAQPTTFFQKSGDARREAGSCCASPCMPWDERAAGVPCHRCRSQERALSFHPGRRWCAA
jgi:hypothetical protein